MKKLFLLMRVMKVWFPLTAYLPSIRVVGKTMLRSQQKRKKLLLKLQHFNKLKRRKKTKRQASEASSPKKSRKELVISIDGEGEEEDEATHLTRKKTRRSKKLTLFRGFSLENIQVLQLLQEVSLLITLLVC